MLIQGTKGYIAQICEVHLHMETVQQNGRFTLISSKFLSNIFSILFGSSPTVLYLQNVSNILLKNKNLIFSSFLCFQYCGFPNLVHKQEVLLIFFRNFCVGNP